MVPKGGAGERGALSLPPQRNTPKGNGCLCSGAKWPAREAPPAGRHWRAQRGEAVCAGRLCFPSVSLAPPAAFLALSTKVPLNGRKPKILEPRGGQVKAPFPQLRMRPYGEGTPAKCCLLRHFGWRLTFIFKGILIGCFRVFFQVNL